jgi:hypothetical protein
MTIRYDLAMHDLYAGRQYGCQDETYEGIIWLEEEAKPTREELEAHWATIEDREVNRQINHNRKFSYPTTEELIVALWEKLVEVDGVTSDAIAEIQTRRLAVKQQFPKG